MSDDWIKMRVNLHSHPKVVRIVSAVCPQNVRNAIGPIATRCMIVGALHAAWTLFDTHSTDGGLDGYGRSDLDQAVGITGFAEAMEAVGWLIVDGNCLRMRDFDSHNGKGAKRRAEDTKSKRVRRMSDECPQDKRTDRGPEEEKTRGEETRGPAPDGPVPEIAPSLLTGDERIAIRQGLIRIGVESGAAQQVSLHPNLTLAMVKGTLAAVKKDKTIKSQPAVVLTRLRRELEMSE